MSTKEKIALSVSEAAEMLGISRPSLYRLTHRDDFPVMRIGGRTLIHKQRLEEWAAAQIEEGR